MKGIIAMKKTVVFLFLLLSMILSSFCFTSCSDENRLPEIDNSYTNSYIFTKHQRTLYKINPITAYATPVCPDPLCMHNDNTCCFYDAVDLEVVGQYIYYLRDSKVWGYSKTLSCFNLEKGTYEVLYEAEEGSITDLFASIQYVFFNYVTVNEGKYEYYIYRYDVKNKKAKCISDKFSTAQEVYAIEGDRVYWRDLEQNAEYSTSIDYKDRNDDIANISNEPTGKYRYEFENTGFDQETFTQLQKLTMIDLSTGKETVVFEALGSFPIPYAGKLIYPKLGERIIIGHSIDKETGELLDFAEKYGGKYYICDADGSNERVLCDVRTIGCEIPLLPDVTTRGAGDWIGSWLYKYEEVDNVDGKKILERNRQLAVINIVTGEIKEVQIETRS